MGRTRREPRNYDVHVRHLREKIERDPSEPDLILTVRGAGYRLREPAGSGGGSGPAQPRAAVVVLGVLAFILLLVGAIVENLA